jgi:catechol 2,3-dioxygenase-like lactoylglutathione lyase family enzyme
MDRRKEATMFDHIGLKATNVDRSIHFYRAVLAGLGHVLCSREASSASFGPKQSEPALYLYLYQTGGPAPAGVHIALTAPTRAAVDRFHAAGLEAGGRDNGGPGLRTDYSPSYYAAFLLDPDGNNIEAVCLHEA